MSYTINDTKLELVTILFNQQVSSATREDLEDAICSDWTEGEEHQEWLDNANAQEIVDWLASFYG